MSREGKRRSALNGLRVVAGVIAFAISVAAAWEVYTVLRVGPARPSLPAAQTFPIGDNVEPVTDGVLDKAWLRRTLALPPTATLSTINPALLRSRVLVGGQVKSAEVVRHFPRTLAVHLAERTPVARLMAESSSGARQEFMVARDGVVYRGQGYDPEMVRSLPWLDGVHPRPGGPGIATINGMDEVADFLGRCNLDAQRLYRTWQVVSLSRLEADGLIEVRTGAGTRIIFNVRGNLYAQIARLDTVLDSMSGAVPSSAIQEINLALDTRVPVTIRGWNAASGRAEHPGESSPAPRPASSANTPFHIYP
jgi:hypothetical protein